MLWGIYIPLFQRGTRVVLLTPALQYRLSGRTIWLPKDRSLGPEKREGKMPVFEENGFSRAFFSGPKGGSALHPAP